MAAQLRELHRHGLRPAELVERLAAAGAVGCSLEDSDPRTGHLVEVDEQVAFLRGVPTAAREAGLDLVINARTDTYLADPPLADPLAETVRRAQAYRLAAADCVYPIMLSDRDAIRRLVAHCGGPVNVLHRLDDPTAPTLVELARLGVARISLGPGLYRTVHGRLAEELTRLRTMAAAWN